MKAVIIEDETTAVNSLKAILAQNTVTGSLRSGLSKDRMTMAPCEKYYLADSGVSWKEMKLSKCFRISSSWISI